MSDDRAPKSGSSTVAWIVAAAAGIAVLSGAAATLHALKPPEPEAGAGKIVSAKEIPSAVHERKTPEQLGFPTPSGAFEFHSMRVDASTGSASFLMHAGTAADVERVYVEKLGLNGWISLWRKPVDVRPDEKRPLVFHGIRARWVNEQKHQQLTLLALDDRQKGHSSQAVLTWSPVTTKKE